MIDSIIKWSLENRLFVLVLAAAMMVWGFLIAREMPLDVFPDLSSPTVTVVTDAHGMAPEEMERLVTFPIETGMNGATGVRRVRSSTSVGISVVWVEFDWGTDIFRARQTVAEKLQLVQASLPPDIAPPVLAPTSSIMGEILFIGLSSETVSPASVRTFAEWELRRRLLAIPGVSQVVPIGGALQQVQVIIRPADLQAYDVSLDEVVESVAEASDNSSAGFYEEGGEEVLLLGLGRATTIEDLKNSVVTAREGLPIRLGDLAHVEVAGGLKRGDAAVSGRPGVIMGIQKQPGVNTLELTRRIEEVLDSVEADLEEGVKLDRALLRQADFIENAVNNVTEALRDGALLVILIIGFFLMSGRATIITALAIPLSLLATVLVLSAMGAGINTMTLGGMAIAVGALVDDAIIDVENIVRRLRQRAAGELFTEVSIPELVFLASKEIRGSIVFATLIIMLVFTPIFFLEGVEGRLLEPLGVAYIVSLGASLVVALTVTPVLSLLLLPNSNAVREGLEPKGVKWLRNRYESLLQRTVGAWKSLASIALIAVLLAGAAALVAGRSFLPEFNEGALTISVVSPPGTSLTRSNEIAGRVERILLSHEEVVSTARRTGRAELDEHAMGTNASEIDVRLQMNERSEAALLAALREEFKQIPGTNIVIGQPISHRIDHMLSGTRANIAVKIFGPDLNELKQLAGLAEAEMMSVPGLVDLAIEEQSHLPVLSMKLDRDAVAMHGLKVHDVTEALETAFYGRTVSQLLMGPYSLDLVVRYPDSARETQAKIRSTRIRAPDGSWVPLEALTTVSRDGTPNQISRENGQRKIVVMANVASGSDLGSAVDQIAERLGKMTLPSGYHIEYGGQFEAAEEAANALFWLSLLVILGIFLLLFVALGSGRDASLVMLNLPLALIGGVVGVWVGGGVISIASIIGFITLFGVATRNGIMMVTHIKHLQREEGVVNPRDAVIQGASERLSPILMTALASGFGLLPLALALGEPGSEIQAPMALVILFGLFSSTLLNMVVVPAMVLRFGSITHESSEQRAA